MVELTVIAKVSFPHDVDLGDYGVADTIKDRLNTALLAGFPSAESISVELEAPKVTSGKRLDWVEASDDGEEDETRRDDEPRRPDVNLDPFRT